MTTQTTEVGVEWMRHRELAHQRRHFGASPGRLERQVQALARLSVAEAGLINTRGLCWEETCLW